MEHSQGAKLFFVLLLSTSAAALVLASVLHDVRVSTANKTAATEAGQMNQAVLSVAQIANEGSLDAPSDLDARIVEMSEEPSVTDESKVASPEVTTTEPSLDIKENTKTDDAKAPAPEPLVQSQPQTQSEYSLSESEERILLDEHNAAREARGISPLAYSNTLAASAQAWAEHLKGESCAWYHSDTQASGVGENIFYSWGSDKNHRRTADEPVFWWLDKEQYYDHEDNECEPGEICGHYTQVVWEDTKYMGCGRVYCDDGEYFKEVWVCQYDPPGNVIGEKPY